MGRTILPYSWQIENTEQRLRNFRKALRKEDQENLDRLMRYARFHVTSGVMGSFPHTQDAMFWSILLEQERTIATLKERIDRLEQNLYARKEHAGNTKENLSSAEESIAHSSEDVHSYE